MTKTRASLHKKSVGQKEAGMETVAVTSVSAISISSSSSVPLEYATDNDEVLAVKLEPLATDTSQSLNTFTSGKNCAVKRVLN